MSKIIIRTKCLWKHEKELYNVIKDDFLDYLHEQYFVKGDQFLEGLYLWKSFYSQIEYKVTIECDNAYVQIMKCYKIKE